MLKKFSSVYWLFVGAILAMPGIEFQGVSLSYIPCIGAILSIPKIYPYLPSSIKILFALGFLAFSSEILFPTENGYLGSRYRPKAYFVTTKFANTVDSENFILWLKFSIAVLGGAIIVSNAYVRSLQNQLLIGFLAGSVISVLVAFFTLRAGEGSYLQSEGLGRTTTTFGMICSYSLALLFRSSLNIDSHLRVILGSFFIAGGLLSGSRGAALTALISLYFVLIWRQKFRRTAWLILVTQTALFSLAIFGKSILEGLSLRAFTENKSTILSSQIRNQLRQQALIDWGQDPIGGVGFSVLNQGHNTYLQTLAAGGLLLFLGYILVDLRIVQAVFQLNAQKSFGYVYGIVFCTVFNHFTQNQIDIPFLYVIACLPLLEARLRKVPIKNGRSS